MKRMPKLALDRETLRNLDAPPAVGEVGVRTDNITIICSLCTKC